MYQHFYQLYLPLILSNSLHMLVVKFDILAFLKVPISEKLFGANKTYRGLLFVSLANAIFFSVFIKVENPIIQSSFALGALLGFLYIFFELPNSFIKRRLGIKAGEKSQRYKWLSLIMDKSDSALGVGAIYSLIFGFSLDQFLIIFLVAFLTHFLVSALLVYFGIKKSF